MTKKQRLRHEKKIAARNASQPPKIPLHEQSIDITPATYNRDTTEAQGDLEAAKASLSSREEITKSARTARRKGIREANFLRGL